MLKEMKVILPTKADPRRPETQADVDHAHHWMRDTLIDAFGGVSIYEGFGAWKAEDRLICEPHKVYICAVPWEAKVRASTMNRLREMVQHVRHMAHQDCIYVVWPNGNVEFVS